MFTIFVVGNLKLIMLVSVLMFEAAIVGNVQVNTSETIRGLHEDQNIGSTSGP